MTRPDVMPFDRRDRLTVADEERIAALDDATRSAVRRLVMNRVDRTVSFLCEHWAKKTPQRDHLLDLVDDLDLEALR